MTTSVDTKSSETESAGATKNETQWTPLYGRWLRVRREQKGISTSDLERSLGVSTKEINTLERNNIRIPLAWIPMLLKRRVLTVAEAKAAVQMPRDKSSAMNGAWLRKQRVQRKLQHADVATKIGVSGKDVEMIEARKWPLPAEWFPALKELFAPPRGVKAKKPAPMPRKAKPPTTAKADKATEQTAKKTAPKTAASAAKATPKSTKANATKQAAATRQDTEPRVATTPVSAAKTATARPAHGLTETIVNYRLMLGERAGLSAVEVLAQIAADLQLALGKDALTYEQLRAAAKALTAG
jgi:transcriptional regulator with XRE-family HTH domain